MSVLSLRRILSEVPALSGSRCAGKVCLLSPLKSPANSRGWESLPAGDRNNLIRKVSNGTISVFVGAYDNQHLEGLHLDGPTG
jgi:hypothetical protein